ncbi:MAG: PAS domain S-box protein [Candidatus Methanoperedens sp.]|nr:PAS domain S-box protein [Candidatus Methanoperedens sp.]
MVVFGSLSYSIFKEKLIEERIEEAESLIDLSSKEISNPLYFLELDKLNDIIRNIKKNPNILSVYIMDSSGRVITDGTTENRFYNQTLEDNLSKRSIHSSELLAEIKNGTLQVSAPAVINEKIGIIRMDFSLKELDQLLTNLIFLLFIIGIVIFIGVAAVDVFVSRSISRPVTNLRDAALEIARGNFDTWIEIESEDEIGELALAFNRMAQDLRRSQDSIIAAKDYTDNIMRSMSDTLMVVSQDGIIRTVNPAACALLGYEDKELIGKPFSAVLADERGSQFSGLYPDELVKKMTVQNVEKTYLSKDSKKIPVVFSASVMHDSSGRIQGIVCVARDITERRTAEEELLKFKLGIERSDEAMFITNIDGTIIYTNPTFERIYGFSREEALGKTPRILKSGLQPSEAYKPFWDTLLAKKVVTGELINKTKDGRLLNIEGSANPILNDRGDIVGFLAIQRDITGRKQAEMEKDRLLKAIDSSTDGITIADEKDRYIYVNAAYAAIFGYTQEELIGETWKKITPSDMIATIEKELPGTMYSRDVGMFSGEVPGLRRDGITIPIEVRGTSLWDENGGYRGHICIARDITERKRIEEELKIKAELLDTATDSILVHDLDGNFIYLNEAAYKSLGYTKDELMKMKLSNMVTPEYGSEIKQKVRDLVEKGEIVFESANVAKDKSVVPVEVHASIIESGGKKLVLSVARDITERKRSEELLKEKARAELYGFIVSALPVFASGVPSQVRNNLVKNFAERFEKNIMPKFQEEIRRLRRDMKIEGEGTENEQEMLDIYMVWLQGLFSNFGIRSRKFPIGTKRCLEFLNCPWAGEAKGNPVFCFICRTIVIRSFTWTELKGNADQSASIANGSPTCRFEVHV